MKDLKTILEASILADIEDTIKTSDEYINVDFNKLTDAKSKEEFNILYDLLRTKLEKNGKKINVVKFAKGYRLSRIKKDECYIAFPDKHKHNMKSLKIANDKTKETMVIGWSETINRIHKTLDFGRSINDVVSRAIYTEVYQVPKEWYNDIENYMRKLRNLYFM